MNFCCSCNLVIGRKNQTLWQSIGMGNAKIKALRIDPIFGGQTTQFPNLPNINPRDLSNTQAACTSGGWRHLRTLFKASFIAAHIAPNAVIQMRPIHFHQIGGLVDEFPGALISQLTQSCAPDEAKEVAVYSSIG